MLKKFSILFSCLVAQALFGDSLPQFQYDTQQYDYSDTPSSYYDHQQYDYSNAPSNDESGQACAGYYYYGNPQDCCCHSIFGDDGLPMGRDAYPIETYYDSESEIAYAENYGISGIWFPEEPPLFRPFIADPRQVCYSVGWRFDDQVLAKNIGDVSFGDSLPIYQWFHVGPYCGNLRIELEGCVWAVFAQCQQSAPLINADYYVAIPVTYAFDEWAFRLRLYHISCHIGDEFLLNHLPRGFKRFNPSAEYLDFFVSNQLTEDIRVYGGVGWVIAQDDSFKIGRVYAECGLELRPQALRYVDYCNRLYGVPFYGMHFRFRRDFKKHLDATYVLGYEWGKFTGLERRLRLYVEYHDGYSAEGQFCRFATNYFSVRASYGF